MDRTLFQMKLTATTQQVALVERDLDAAQPAADALAGARDNARKAALGLAALHDLFNDVTEPAPSTRECPACGKIIMAAATRCGFCWTKIVLTATG